MSNIKQSLVDSRVDHARYVQELLDEERMRNPDCTVLAAESDGKFARSIRGFRFSLDIMFWKEKWLFLDGLHRLVKVSVLGQDKVKVRKIPKEAIPLITK